MSYFLLGCPTFWKRLVLFLFYFIFLMRYGHLGEGKLLLLIDTQQL